MSDDVRAELARHGKARAAAKARASRESMAIRDLVPRAVAAGISKAEIARLARISRPALDAILRDS